MSTPPLPDMDELLQRLLDGQLGPDEMKRLEKAMLEDPRVRDYYVDSMLACAVVRRSSQATGELSESDLIQSLQSGRSRGGSKHVMRHLYLIAAVLVLGALIVVSVSMFHHILRGPAIGTLAGAYEAQWEGADPRPGEPLYTGSYELRQGVAKMELSEGTSLLLEAPCQIELKSLGEVTLETGRLTVAVSPQAKGFQVRTRTAVITDLGTEFGVVVLYDGSTVAHVFKGSIDVALDPDGASSPKSLVVNEGQAAVVEASGRTIRGGLAARADFFLLRLPPVSQPSGPAGRLNLADIVGGGNGRGTGQLDRGIDPGSGRAFQGHAKAVRQTRRNEFRPSPQFRGIDGVFVPNAAFGPVVISSTGLLFAQCPQTQGSCYDGPANSGEFFGIITRQTYRARLNGVEYGTSEHPALTLHPNAGITFDLDQIRRDNPDLRIDRFTAVCTVPKEAPHAQMNVADVWILLDGAVRFHMRYPPDRNVVGDVDIPITPQTRFLTLVTTCSGDAGYSWIFFGNPFLEPAATN
jgi:ferric-dicitrate binding protein FerR (iron transport regulator)